MHLRIVRVADAPAASRPTASQWPVPQASHPAFDVQACVVLTYLQALSSLSRLLVQVHWDSSSPWVETMM